jgi:hypothetical protein
MLLIVSSPLSAEMAGRVCVPSDGQGYNNVRLLMVSIPGLKVLLFNLVTLGDYSHESHYC